LASIISKLFQNPKPMPKLINHCHFVPSVKSIHLGIFVWLVSGKQRAFSLLVDPKKSLNSKQITISSLHIFSEIHPAF